MMRIITGRARGVRLASLEGENTRPTSERVKEAVFSMLQFEMEDRQVLDLFAGSGQLGLEAVSRGAAHAVLVDRSKDAVEIVKKNCLKTKLALDCEVFCADYAEFLRTCRGRRTFDLVFLDPPYANGVLPTVLKMMTDYRILSPNATLVCETANEGDVFGEQGDPDGRFEVLRQVRYGAAFVTVLRYTEVGA